MHWGSYADEKSELAYSKGGKRPESQRIETTPYLFWVLIFSFSVVAPLLLPFFRENIYRKKDPNSTPKKTTPYDIHKIIDVNNRNIL